ncbi:MULTISPECIES: plastocyanin/azurin family domain protein [unclassified Sphingomonas]|uniref:plastocyanin/azurin family domain protein n=1 Tax=unclassified Sphingomonas TaxID=196159 RepID=UPI0008365DA2|nr:MULTISPECIES: plastocyanin/azurin family domain protein [unclassified Sphingomonas]MCH4894635.1 methylamine utilization protein [Sphingomonas sp. SFZ2018-12]
MVKFSAVCAIAALSTVPAWAGELELRVVDAAGTPIRDAVVTVMPAGGVSDRPIRFPWGTTMVQRDIAFQPHVLIVPVGASVAFPNRDKVRHHIYSFSKPARFELKLYGRDEVRSYTFKTPGAVALGCNIHDRMSGFIKVVDTPYAIATGGDGIARIAAVPAGPARVTVWHPRSRARDNEIVQTMVFAATGQLARQVQLQLR